MKTMKLVAAAALLAGFTGAAHADVTTATGSGWITASGATNNSGFAGGITNNFAGFENGVYSDWFTFVAPTNTVTSATLSIWNDAANTTIDPAALYSVHGATSYTFAGLGDGPSFGSVALTVADNGTSHFVDIAFDAAGIGFLNSHLGQSVSFGGVVASTVDPATCNDCVAVFGFTAGQPAATLTTDAVPEPASWALMVAGFGLVGAAVRRRAVTVAA